jgi:DNA (cytosine-5)-methyltransferase 1
MTAYYNEFDPFAAQWLRNLIEAGLIAPGIVDDRSINDVTAADLNGFTQCHFFAGIGGWSLALRLAGVPDTYPLWTGSPPCQPFSVAGKQLGQLDDRHLAPTFMQLVDQCQPAILFGEQVAAAIGKHWLDDLFAELERQGYACGASVLPAASVGAPHKRDRLFFGAVRILAHSDTQQRESSDPRPGENKEPQGKGKSAEFAGPGAAGELDDGQPFGRQAGRYWDNSGDDGKQPAAAGENCSVADTDNTRLQGRERMPERADQQLAGAGCVDGILEYTNDKSLCAAGHGSRDKIISRAGKASTPASPHNSFWSGADWLGCRDGKFRPVESGSFPLAYGVPARVGRLRGYGNAIVPQAAAEFIKAFTAACGEHNHE